MATVRATQSAIVRVDGIPVSVREGQAYDDKDPIVLASPTLFVSDVEEATARPGERRNTRRPS
jgi:hypothetical protein